MKKISVGNFEFLGGFIRQSFGRHQDTRAIAASQICAQSRLAWPGLKPISFREGVLKIKAGNSAEANDWKMEEREIIIKINRVIGQEAVKRLIIV